MAESSGGEKPQPSHWQCTVCAFKIPELPPDAALSVCPQCHAEQREKEKSGALRCVHCATALYAPDQTFCHKCGREPKNSRQGIQKEVEPTGHDDSSGNGRLPTTQNQLSATSTKYSSSSRGPMTTQEHLQTSQSETTPLQGQPSPPTLEATQNPPPTTSKSTQLVPKATTQHGPLAEPPHDPPLHDSEDETRPLPSAPPEDNSSPHQPESPTERDGVSHTPHPSSNYKLPIQESGGEAPGHKHNGQPPGQKPIGQSPGGKTGGQHPAPTVSESTSSQKSTQADAKSSDATTPEVAGAEAEAIPKQKYTQLFGDQTKKLNTLDSDQPSHPNQKEKEEKEKRDHPSGADSGPLQDTNRHPLEASHRKRGSSDTHTAPEQRQPKPESGAEGESQVNKVIKVAGYVTTN